MIWKDFIDFIPHKVAPISNSLHNLNNIAMVLPIEEMLLKATVQK